MHIGFECISVQIKYNFTVAVYTYALRKFHGLQKSQPCAGGQAVGILVYVVRDRAIGILSHKLRHEATFAGIIQLAYVMLTLVGFSAASLADTVPMTKLVVACIRVIYVAVCDYLIRGIRKKCGTGNRGIYGLAGKCR